MITGFDIVLVSESGKITEYHTTDLDRICSLFWLNPNGQLFRVDYPDQEVTFDKLGDVTFKRPAAHGQICPIRYTGELRLYDKCGGFSLPRAIRLYKGKTDACLLM